METKYGITWEGNDTVPRTLPSARNQTKFYTAQSAFDIKKNAA